ncbi:MAG TPA: molybdate ABC transporter substrate-binding protein [Caulobacteraceae bacterium]
MRPQNWRRRDVLALFGAAATATPLAAQPRAAHEPITVFAAASLKNAMDDVGKAYLDATGTQVRISYASSSVIARQIEEGAPADIFVSADTDWMDELAKRGLIVASSRRNLLANHLALIAPANSTTQIAIRRGMPLATALGGGRLAMAGPDVPAGRYGQAALEALGVWPSVESHLARGENVRATLAFVARGETPLGIVYDTDAKVEPAVRIVGLFPENSHSPIVYPAALVAASRNPGAAALLQFMEGPKAGAIFARYGFRRAG